MNDEMKAIEREMDKHFPKVTEAHSAGAYYDWEWQGCGFGQLSFGVKDGVWHCDTECMGPISTRKLLHAFADYVADQLTPVIEAERAESEARRASYEKVEAEKG